jgi:hypothetical protein
MTDEHDEGWYTDPYGRHEARWISAGSPTKLVRDGSVESYDDAPDQEPSEVPTEIVIDPVPRTDQLDRADEAATESLPTAGEFADVAVFGVLSTWHLNRRKPRNP